MMRHKLSWWLSLSSASRRSSGVRSESWIFLLKQLSERGCPRKRWENDDYNDDRMLIMMISHTILFCPSNCLSMSTNDDNDEQNYNSTTCIFNDDFPRNEITKITTTTFFTWKRRLNVVSGALESHGDRPKDMFSCCLFELEVNIMSYYHHDAVYHSYHHEHHHKPVFQVPAWIQSSSRHAEVAPASTKVRNCNYKINKIQQVQKWGIAITKLTKSYKY